MSLLLKSILLAVVATADPLGVFFRSVTNKSVSVPLHEQSKWMEGMSHYRLLPGIFPSGMDFHFDGLATVMQFKFEEGELVVKTSYYESETEKNYKNCFYLGSGTTHYGFDVCMKNPAVNLLPIEGQLWLTIDTFSWGRVDPDTLATLPGSPDTKALTLNAHPACDPMTGECFVQHPCPKKANPRSNQACFSKLMPEDVNIGLAEIGRATLPENKILQHSHSPCVTPNYLVSKLDSFDLGSPVGSAGILRFVHQAEDNDWLVMDRRTNQTRVLKANMGFVNNHFWNCFERDGHVVVDSATATEDYLDNYFRQNLEHPQTNWTKLFYAPQRCLVPFEGSNITCAPFIKEESLVFDYPTFNPVFKMKADYRFFYGIAPHRSPSDTSRWFQRIIKFDAQGGAVLKEWSAPNVYVTEADFIPRSTAPGSAEDDGVLVSVIYNSTSDSSAFAVFDAETLALLDTYSLPEVVPFHAHGISCRPKVSGGHCFPNP